MAENNKTELSQAVANKIHPLLMIHEVVKKFLAVILVAMIAMACMYVYKSHFYEPQYRTRTTFVVSLRNGAPSVYSNLSAAKETANSFAQILKSDVMVKQLKNELNTNYIAGTIETQVVDETNILELRITSPTPQDAYKITTTLLDCYEPLTEKVLSNVALDILQYPTVPTSPINPLSLKKPVMLAGIAAALATAAVLCAMAYLRDTVKTTEDAESKLDTKVLGTIRYENKYKTLKSKIRRKKTSILITKSTTGFSFVESFKKLRTRLDYNMRRNDQKVLMVTSAAEDEGKSTVSVNLALAMRKKYEKVLLIDADMKKSAVHKILEVNRKRYPALSDVLENKLELEDAIIKDEASGLYLLLSRNYGDNSTDLIIGRQMKALIEKVRAEMDVVIIDTPPMAVSPDSECIAELADAALLVVRQDMTPVRVVNDMIDVLHASRAKLLGCVLNNFRSADFDDNFTYGQDKYGYGKYGYGKYGYSKYGYNKHGYNKYGYSKRGYGKYGGGYGYGASANVAGGNDFEGDDT